MGIGVFPNSAQLLGRFRRDRRGNIAVIFALTLVPMLSCIGCAIDYSRATQLRSKLQAAIDAASVGSVSKKSPAFIAAGSMTSDGPIPAGVSDAKKLFKGNMSGATGYTLNSMTAAVTKSGGSVTSTTAFSAEVPTTFMKVIGKTAMTVTGTSTAITSMPLYIDFYLLLDNSPSMGVGARPTSPGWSATRRTPARSPATTSTTTTIITSSQRPSASPRGSTCCAPQPSS